MHLTEYSTYLLMPSDKHNLRTARATDLISLLINVASSWDMPFHQPQQLQCLHHGATLAPICAPILSSNLQLKYIQVTIYSRCVMISVRDIKTELIAAALLTLFFVIKWVRHSWNWDAMAFTYRDMGHVFHKWIFCTFHNGWMDCRDGLHAVPCL